MNPSHARSIRRRHSGRQYLSGALLVVAQLFSTATLLAQPAPQSAMTLPTGPRYPNGIAVTADGTIFTGFVTSGVILRQPTGGKWETYFPGSEHIHAATSLRLDPARNLLWGTSPDFLVEGRQPRRNRLFALDVDTAAVRRLIDVPEGSFANDIAIEPDGGVLVTDSFKGRILRLAPGADRLEATVDHSALAPPPAGIGVSGIARAGDGRLALANFGTGRLLAVEVDGTVREIRLPRMLANPDGLALAADGALIVCEGDIEGGNGRVLRIADPFASGERTIQVLAAGLESPVNLSLSPQQEVLVTEARIRHRLVTTTRVPAPESFRIIRLGLGVAAAE